MADVSVDGGQRCVGNRESTDALSCGCGAIRPVAQLHFLWRHHAHSTLKSASTFQLTPRIGKVPTAGGSRPQPVPAHATLVSPTQPPPPLTSELLLAVVPATEFATLKARLVKPTALEPATKHQSQMSLVSVTSQCHLTI